MFSVFDLAGLTLQSNISSSFKHKKVGIFINFTLSDLLANSVWKINLQLILLLKP